MMQTQQDTALRWDAVTPGDPCPVSTSPETCSLTWPEPAPTGIGMWVAECTRPPHEKGQHVATDETTVLAVHSSA